MRAARDVSRSPSMLYGSVGSGVGTGVGVGVKGGGAAGAGTMARIGPAVAVGVAEGAGVLVRGTEVGGGVARGTRTEVTVVDFGAGVAAGFSGPATGACFTAPPARTADRCLVVDGTALSSSVGWFVVIATGVSVSKGAAAATCCGGRYRNGPRAAWEDDAFVLPER
ncbi:MAG: hypothetical protein ACRDFS_11970 [Chloroflexota bacterium]